MEERENMMAEPLALPTDWVKITAFRVAEEPGRIPVDVKCPCGQHISFRQIYVYPAVGTRWKDGDREGLCPSCRRPIRVTVTVSVKAEITGRPEPEEEGGDADAER